LLGSRKLSVGSNNLSTTFSGAIQGSGSFTKLGTGTLILNAPSTYTGTTTVSAGSLVVSNNSGSGSGTGAVQVTAGTLGGGGTISGAVTVGTGSGTGAFLGPAHGTNKQATLTTQSAMTFNADATYTYTFKAKRNKARTDKVVANGVTINGGSFAFQGTAQGTLRQGLVLIAISNTAATPIFGTFSNLPDGAILTANRNNFQASYEGGDGNDLTLTVVP
jgi:autotransporter-associated beta strand protein